MIKLVVIKYKDVDNAVHCNVIDPDTKKSRPCKFNNLKLKNIKPGLCYEMEVDENYSISYSSSQLPVSKWPIEDDVNEWLATQAGENGKKALLKNISRATLIETLIPISAAYKKAQFRERQLILAEIIRIITA